MAHKPIGDPIDPIKRWWKPNIPKRLGGRAMLKETAITNAKLLEMHENGWTVIDRNGRAYPIQGWVHWRVGSLGFNESISGQARQLPEGGETGRLTVTVTSTGFAQIDYVPIAQLIGGPEASS